MVQQCIVTQWHLAVYIIAVFQKKRKDQPHIVADHRISAGGGTSHLGSSRTGLSARSSGGHTADGIIHLRSEKVPTFVADRVDGNTDRHFFTDHT